MGFGARSTGFKCPSECDDTARLVLLRYACVVAGSVQRKGDLLAFDIDLSEIGDREFACAERAILVDLMRAVSLHAVPDLQLVDFRAGERR